MRSSSVKGLPVDFERGEGGIHEEQRKFILSLIAYVSGINYASNYTELQGTHFGRSILDLDESTLDEYLELCERGLLKPETLRSGMDGRTGNWGRQLIQSGQISERWRTSFLSNRAELGPAVANRRLNGHRVINVRRGLACQWKKKRIGKHANRGKRIGFTDPETCWAFCRRRWSW